MKASLYSGQRASELLPVLAYSDDAYSLQL